MRLKTFKTVFLCVSNLCVSTMFLNLQFWKCLLFFQWCKRFVKREIIFWDISKWEQCVKRDSNCFSKLLKQTMKIQTMRFLQKFCFWNSLKLMMTHTCSNGFNTLTRYKKTVQSFLNQTKRQNFFLMQQQRQKMFFPGVWWPRNDERSKNVNRQPEGGGQMKWSGKPTVNANLNFKYLNNWNRMIALQFGIWKWWLN